MKISILFIVFLNCFFLCLFLCIFILFSFLFLSFLSVTHNSTTIRYMEILYIPNDCSVNEDHLFLFGAAVEIQIMRYSPESASRMQCCVSFRPFFGFSRNNMCIPGVARIVQVWPGYTCHAWDTQKLLWEEKEVCKQDTALLSGSNFETVARKLYLTCSSKQEQMISISRAVIWYTSI